MSFVCSKSCLILSPQGEFFLCILGNSFYIMLEPLLLIWKAWLHGISNNMVTMSIKSCSSCFSQNDSWSQNCCKVLKSLNSWHTGHPGNFLQSTKQIFFLKVPYWHSWKKHETHDDLQSKLKFVCAGIFCVGGCYWISSGVILNSLNFCFIWMVLLYLREIFYQKIWWIRNFLFFKHWSAHLEFLIDKGFALMYFSVEQNEHLISLCCSVLLGSNILFTQ